MTLRFHVLRFEAIIQKLKRALALIRRFTSEYHPHLSYVTSLLQQRIVNLAPSWKKKTTDFDWPHTDKQQPLAN